MPDLDLTQLKMPSIVDIHILESHVTMPNDLSSPILDYNFFIDINHKMDLKHDQVFTTVEVFINPINDKKNVIGRFKIGFQVLILGLSELNIKPVDDKILIPDDIGRVLNGILYSTTRGIIFMQVKGTFMHTAIMPVLDSSKFSEPKN